jgi:predicted DNA-binding WGR domain protein
MTEQPTLFAAVDLIVEWGRLGSIPRVRIERFTDDARLAARRRELLARRRLHGYQEQFQQEEETTADARPTSPMAGVPALG